jgi:hypothetical protein
MAAQNDLPASNTRSVSVNSQLLSPSSKEVCCGREGRGLGSAFCFFVYCYSSEREELRGVAPRLVAVKEQEQAMIRMRNMPSHRSLLLCPCVVRSLAAVSVTHSHPPKACQVAGRLPP